MTISRRKFVHGSAVVATALSTPLIMGAGGKKPRVVVVGGGAGGATAAAKYLAKDS